MRLIDADALIESIKNTADLGGWIGEALYQIKQVAIKYIDSAPTIEPKRGEWIEENGRVICSECRRNALRTMTGCLMDRHLDYNKSDFCPNCGADMREREGE